MAEQFPERVLRSHRNHVVAPVPSRSGAVAAVVSKEASSGVERKLRVGVFGTFYPMFKFVGNATSGIVITLCDLPEVEKVRVYCPRGSLIPPGVDETKIELVPLWEHDNPLSLVRVLGRMARDSRSIDMVVFNIFVSAFGKRGLSNATGLLLPFLLSHAIDRPVIVYMHNFVETQDIERLGYSPNRLVRFVARTLEGLLLRTTAVAVPLESQRALIREAFSRNVTNLFLPYVDALVSLKSMPITSTNYLPSPSQGAGPRLLLFGSWGPQKDLEGILEVVGRLVRSGAVSRVTVAGAANVHFHDADRKIEDAFARFGSVSFERIPFVKEEDVLPLLAAHDVLFLPYNTTGGVSGAMNCAALAGIEVIAYDLPQLREQVALLHTTVQFVRQGDRVAIEGAIRHVAELAGTRQRPTVREMEAMTAYTRSQVQGLLRLS